MELFRGITWDHPRGRRWLEASTTMWRERGIEVAWESQPLEGFEAHPIDELCAAYDLVVLDHPHVGDALGAASLLPLDVVLGASSPALAERYVGSSLESYKFGGRPWALPIDAATQVSARDARLVSGAPCTWEEVIELGAEVPVALSIAGPHALLSLFSIAASLGAPPIDEPGRPWLDREAAFAALDIMRRVHETTLARIGRGELRDTLNDNPIALLERIGSNDALAYVPLVYGYVNYSAPEREVRVAFTDAPRAVEGGLPGSIIGGTGVAVSAKTLVTDRLRNYLEWLVSPSTQSGFAPDNAGQPATLDAWSDASVDTAAGEFYSSTFETLAAASIRPRYAGFPEAQQAGSAIVRDALEGKLSPSAALDTLDVLAATSRERGLSHAALNSIQGAS